MIPKAFRLAASPAWKFCLSSSGSLLGSEGLSLSLVLPEKVYKCTVLRGPYNSGGLAGQGCYYPHSIDEKTYCPEILYVLPKFH